VRGASHSGAITGTDRAIRGTYVTAGSDGNLPRWEVVLRNGKGPRGVTRTLAAAYQAPIQPNGLRETRNKRVNSEKVLQIARRIRLIYVMAKRHFGEIETVLEGAMFPSREDCSPLIHFGAFETHSTPAT